MLKPFVENFAFFFVCVCDDVLCVSLFFLYLLSYIVSKVLSSLWHGGDLTFVNNVAVNETCYFFLMCISVNHYVNNRRNSQVIFTTIL